MVVVVVATAVVVVATAVVVVVPGQTPDADAPPPVPRDIAPLAPAAEAPAVDTAMLPLAPEDEAPDVTSSAPPTPAAVAPALTITSPPSFWPLEPAAIDTEPGNAAADVASDTEPDMPPLDEPLLTTKSPLASVPRASAVKRSTLPLEPVAAAPLLRVTALPSTSPAPPAI